LQRDHLPLKVLAARLGYADVSHFSNAFTRKFGYRPGGARRP
jgi:AraC-like DNA-binding protein